MSNTPSQTAELSQEEVCCPYRVRVAKLASVYTCSLASFSRSLPQMRRRRLQRLGGLTLQSPPPSLTPSPAPGPASLPHIKTTSPEGRKAVSSIYLQCGIVRIIGIPSQREEGMEVDSSSLPLRLQSRSAGTTPTSINPSIRPKAKRSHTGELAPTHTLLSPSTPPHPHSSLLSLLAQTFRVSLTVSHNPSSLVPWTFTNGSQPEPPRGLPDLVPLPHLTTRLKDLGEKGKENRHHFSLSLSVCPRSLLWSGSLPTCTCPGLHV